MHVHQVVFVLLCLLAAAWVRGVLRRPRSGGEGPVTAAVEQAQPRRHRVRVWFGEHVIADYNTEPAFERYAHAMSRRFAGLRVTNDPFPSTPQTPAEDS